MSLELNYLNEILTKIETDIDNVYVNDSIEISSFVLEQIINNLYELKFSVLQSQTTQINNLKLRKSDNSVISSHDVDIPITESEVHIRYKYTISEVVSSWV